MAFAAVSESVPLSCWLMFLANILWAVAYDTQYAMVDRDDDLKIGIKSTAILFGEHDRLIIGILQVAVLALMVAIGWLNGWAGNITGRCLSRRAVCLAAEADFQSRTRRLL
jgi:4-hydroxybenzoate polyprenyltransferase